MLSSKTAGKVTAAQAAAEQQTINAKQKQTRRDENLRQHMAISFGVELLDQRNDFEL